MADETTKDDLLRELLLRDIQKPKTAEEAKEIGKAVRERLQVFSKKHEFRPGMLVEWKPGLRNKKRPAYGEPAVVVEVLSDPALSTNDESGSQYFREPLDLIVGVLDPDGDFVLFHYDGRRFQPFGENV